MQAEEEGKSLAKLALTKKQDNLASTEGRSAKSVQEKKPTSGEADDDDWGESGKGKGKKKEKKGKSKTKGKTGAGQTSGVLLIVVYVSMK